MTDNVRVLRPCIRSLYYPRGLCLSRPCFFFFVGGGRTYPQTVSHDIGVRLSGDARRQRGYFWGERRRAGRAEDPQGQRRKEATRRKTKRLTRVVHRCCVVL